MRVEVSKDRVKGKHPTFEEKISIILKEDELRGMLEENDSFCYFGGWHLIISVKREQSDEP